MTANELRIGNIVHCPGQILPITAIDSDRELDSKAACSVRLGSLVATWLDQLKPIPLSKEWLSRAGFDKRIVRIDRHGGEDWFDISTVMVNDDVDNPEWRYLFTMNGGSLIVVQYVHQLQNLYFALAGEELTISLLHDT